jgi:flavin-dependent dehydrogenase
MLKPITIAGGGIAGLTLGVLLRQVGVPVEIWDAGRYPRHKVCGEFMSGRGAALLQRLDRPIQLRGVFSRSICFFDGNVQSAVMQLPDPACCVSRFELDASLASVFARSGGILLQGCRWTESFEGEGVVRASGRRLVRDEGPAWTGIKIHARHYELRADLELHCSSHGYVGISELPDGEVNICGLLRAVPKIAIAERRMSHPDFLSYFGTVLGNETIARFKGVDFDIDSFCSVAGISLKTDSAGCSEECRVGDSISIIAPLTGNGMSLAIETAFLAAPFLAAYSRGELDWAKARGEISQCCDKRFRLRRRFSSILQKIVLSQAGRNVMLSSFKTMPSLLRMYFRLTR